MNVTDTDQIVSKRKRHWLPRFSLLTLLLSVLLAGSGATLWWNWGPYSLKRLHHLKPVLSAEFSPDGAWLATCDGFECLIWKMPYAENYQALSHIDKADGVRWSPDGRLFCSIDNVGLVHIWNTKTWQCTQVLGHCDQLPKNGFSLDGRRLITLEHTSDGYNAYLWNTDSGKRLAEFGEQQHFEGFSTDSRFLLINVRWTRYDSEVPITDTQRADTGIELWDAHSGERIWRANLKEYLALKNLVSLSDRVSCEIEEFNPNALFEIFKFHREYDLMTGEMLRNELIETTTGYKFSFSLTNLSETLSPNSKLRVYRDYSTINSRGDWDSLAVEETDTKRRLCKLPGFFASTSRVKSLFSPDGTQILAANYHCENDAYLWTQRRPFEWYGIAWLPEFWLTFIFSAGLLWSLFRDRKNA